MTPRSTVSQVLVEGIFGKGDMNQTIRGEGTENIPTSDG